MPHAWSDAWLDALLAFSHPGRMRRGRRFANEKAIKDLEILPGEIRAQVKDGRKTYEVEIRYPPIDDATWERIIDKLASQALYSAKLMQGEIPPEIIELVEEAGASLFATAEKLDAQCTCPDWEVPCKHIAGVYYYLAEQFEKDPFLLFYFRGRARDELLDALRAHRAPSRPASEEKTVLLFKDPPLEQVLEHFWEIGPTIHEISFQLTPSEIPLPHFKRLGRPSFTALDLEAILRPVYDTVTETTLAWVHQKPEQDHDRKRH
ncbi:MAG TPA: hypothetical protein ENK60_06100 [Anaerolineae bacterium]|nr:hypothetical protein [Anaerolineae bacterium]